MGKRCDNCRFARHFKKPFGPDPETKPYTFWEKIFGRDMFYGAEWKIRMDWHKSSVLCIRYPKEMHKRKDDTCGEFIPLDFRAALKETDQ